MTSSTTTGDQAIFKLQDRTADWNGFKLWTLTFDLPGEKVNKLSRKVMETFDSTLRELENLANQDRIEVLVLLSGKPGNFIAGADIEMLQAAKTSEEAEGLSRMGQKLMERWEDLSFPTVAAINGTALGGGLEFSLSCSAIVMSNDPAAKIGLPEVNLGLIPGMGGCVRLPRKVGLATSLDMILTGKTLSGDRAARAGVVEACLPKENFNQAVFTWVKNNISALKSGARLAKEPKLGGMGGPLGAMMEKTPMGRSLIFKKARAGVIEKTKNKYPAPLEALDTIQSTGGSYGTRLRGQAREKAMIREAQGFGRVAVTDVCRNLIRLFFLTESVKKARGLPAGVSADAKPIKTAAVLGAGIMGGGIAQLFADKGISIRMKDLNSNALTLGIQAASRIFKKQVQQKRLTERDFLQRLNLISPTLDYSGFQGTDLVVEAVIENLEIKQKVLKELEEAVKDDCVIATNTSSLSVSKMQSVMKTPSRFVGMHFFNPVHRMPLVEVIRGDGTSNEAVTTIFQLSKQLGKTPIVVKDRPGFLVNRLLGPYMIEANYLLAEGVPIEIIDSALENFGMPMGPLTLIDEVGIDVADKVAHILNEAFGARMLPADLNTKVIKAGRLGRKNGKGLYEYPQGKDKVLDPKIYEILGVTPSSGAVTEEEIVDRTILPMVNEAARCLEEGIVATASEVDLGMIMGTGFPPFRGGLLRYADSIGPSAIVEKLRKYEARFGARFTPAPALVSRAEHGQRFYPT